jgi:hypothetical protein
MKIKTYNCYNEYAEGKLNPINTIKQACDSTDIILDNLKELNTGLLETFVNTLRDKLDEIVKDFKLDSSQFDLKTITNDLKTLREQSGLTKAIVKFVCYSLDLPTNYNPEEGEVNILYSNAFKARENLSYHRVKTLIELLGNKKGSEIYKKIVPDLITDMKKRKGSTIDKTKDPHEISLNEQRESSIKTWCKIGLVDFTVAVFDEYKILYRFDKCGVHETLKEFADPDTAYLASCYIGDAKEFNAGEIVQMRRTQTLHHGKFCDELYWNNFVYKDTKQPSLAFTESLTDES